ncbi:MAG: Undecaprenyl-diphosphate phosphatase [Bacteroidota bacterium]|jgi:membrane-associated phospholipid phosphatase
MKKGFWFGFFLFNSIILIYLLKFSRLDQIILINQTHTAFGDSIFVLLSFLAEILIPIILAIFVFIKKRSDFYLLLLSYFIVTIVVQLLKHQIFPDYARPISYFADQNIDFYTIKGLIIHQRNSFPSGHTATAWWIAFWLVRLFAKNNKQAILFSSFGFGVALSRVYLLQHFPVDTLFGALIGTVFTYLCVFFYTKIYVKNLDQ